MCDEINCHEIHIQNPSTKLCIEKTSVLGKLILKNNKNNKEEEEKTLHEKLNIILDLLKTIQDKIIRLEEKNNEKFSEEANEINKMEEISNAIKILKNQFNIVASNNVNDKNNLIIQNVLNKVKENLENGKKTIINSNFIKNYI